MFHQIIKKNCLSCIVDNTCRDLLRITYSCNHECLFTFRLLDTVVIDIANLSYFKYLIRSDFVHDNLLKRRVSIARITHQIYGKLFCCPDQILLFLLKL